MVLVLDAQFLSLVAGLDVPVRFTELLRTPKVMDADSFALMACDEKEVKVAILEWAKAVGVDVAELHEQFAIKKLWVACRKIFSNETNASAPASSTHPMTLVECVPKEVEQDLKNH